MFPLVYVRSDLYNAGKTEDGEDFNAEVYYVVIEYEDGNRIGHFHSFFGTKKEEDPDGGVFFPDLRQQAKAAAETLAKQIEIGVRSGHPLNPSCWRVMEPAYGSRAYQLQEFYHG